MSNLVFWRMRVAICSGLGDGRNDKNFRFRLLRNASPKTNTSISLVLNFVLIALLFGLGVKNVHASPTRTMAAISASQSHTAALKNNGTVQQTWGRNCLGELGDGTIIERHNRVEVLDEAGDSLDGVVAIGTNTGYTVAHRDDGRVLSWRSNYRGKLGDDTTDDSPNPVEVLDVEGKPLSLAGNSGITEYGVTIITHGFQPMIKSNSTAPDWAKAMGAAILKKRALKGRLWQFDVDTGLMIDLSVDPYCGDGDEQIPCDFDMNGGEKVILVNWMGTSNNGTPGFAEEAGHALYSLLVGGAKGHPVPVLGDLNNPKPIHFIGHSFGTAVNSEAIQRLGHFFPSINVDHVTTLDPHDFDQGPNRGYDDGIPNVYRWNNVRFLDNYYQTKDPIGPSPHGRAVPGAQWNNENKKYIGFELTGYECFEGALENASNTIDCRYEWDSFLRNLGDVINPLDDLFTSFGPHSRVHTFYHGTIDSSTIGNQKVDGLLVRESWYPHGMKDRHGYAYSRLGGKKNRSSDFPTKETDKCLIDPSHFNEEKITPVICKSGEGYADDVHMDEPPGNLFGGSFTIMPRGFGYPGFSAVPGIVYSNQEYTSGYEVCFNCEIMGINAPSFRLKTQLNYIPRNATQLLFDWNVIEDDWGSSDELAITIEVADAHKRYQIPVEKTSSWAAKSIKIPDDLHGKSATIEMVLRDDALLGTVGSAVRIDNIRLSTVPLPGELGVVGPIISGFEGVKGGPFDPGSLNYKIKNIGGQEIYCEVRSTDDWLNFTTIAQLGPKESTDISIRLNSQADNLPVGKYTGYLLFENKTNNNGNTKLEILLEIVPAGRVIVEEGTCPYEGCMYGETQVEKRITLYLEKDEGSQTVAVVQPGTKVTIVSGDSHTKVKKFVVSRDYLSYGYFYEVGDVLLVYSYRGEGYYNIEFSGETYYEDLGFSPYGGSGGTRCQEDSINCWGELDREYSSTWWILVQLPNGKQGWSKRDGIRTLQGH